MLTAVEKLKASLRQSFSAGGDGAEAVVKNVDVLKAIEEVIQDIVLQLSQGKAPALSFHKRTQWSNIRFDDTVGLQMAPDCTVSTVRSDCCTSVVRFSLILKVLSMIYKLVQSNTYATKRDIYYNDTQLFGSQRNLDLIVIDISCMLKVPRRSLHVLATSKGFIAGDLCYTEEDGTRVNCSSNSTDISVHNVAQYLNSEDVSSAAQFLLIVEKDATFQRLLDDEFCIKLAPCIIITSMSFDARSLTVPAVMWLGLLPSDMERLNVPKEVLIPLTKRDLSKLKSLQKRPYMSCQPHWNKEMEIMVKCNMKAELQSLTALAPDYLTRVYLANKLQFGGWI
ncbi:UNVERIFIED_CONTAM: hypothetical protein FKN15_014181 [Acipenser sinensis]